MASGSNSNSPRTTGNIEIVGTISRFSNSKSEEQLPKKQVPTVKEPTSNGARRTRRFQSSTFTGLAHSKTSTGPSTAAEDITYTARMVTVQPDDEKEDEKPQPLASSSSDHSVGECRPLQDAHEEEKRTNHTASSSDPSTNRIPHEEAQPIDIGKKPLGEVFQEIERRRSEGADLVDLLRVDRKQLEEITRKVSERLRAQQRLRSERDPNTSLLGTGDHQLQIFVFLLYAGFGRSIDEFAEHFGCTREEIIRIIVNVSNAVVPEFPLSIVNTATWQMAADNFFKQRNYPFTFGALESIPISIGKLRSEKSFLLQLGVVIDAEGFLLHHEFHRIAKHFQESLKEKIQQVRKDLRRQVSGPLADHIPYSLLADVGFPLVDLSDEIMRPYRPKDYNEERFNAVFYT